MFMHVRSPRRPRPEDDGADGGGGVGHQHSEYQHPSQAHEQDEHLTGDLEDGRLVASFHKLVLAPRRRTRAPTAAVALCPRSRSCL